MTISFSDLLIPLPFTIVDIELTQAIQYFGHHSKVPGGRITVDGFNTVDNSIPLWEEKPTLVRVYVQAQRKYRGTLTGSVHVGSLTGHLLKPVGPFPEIRWFGDEGDTFPVRDLDQFFSGFNLNFLMPGNLCLGSRTLFVEVHEVIPTVLRALGQAGHVSTMRIQANFSPSRRPTLRGVLVQTFRDGKIHPRPAPSELLDTLAPMMPMLPWPGFDFSPCVTTDFAQELKQSDDRASQYAWWQALSSQLATLQDASYPADVIVGLVASDLPWTGGSLDILGVGGNGVAIASAHDSRSLVHEIGHAFGLDHAPACSPGPVIDPNYPVYAPYPMGSIGEYGADTSRIAVLAPVMDGNLPLSTDIMGNCSVFFPPSSAPFQTAWISPYHYLKMAGVGPAHMELRPWMPKVQAYIVSFSVEFGKNVKLLHGFHLTGVSISKKQREAHLVRIQAVDRDGNVLNSEGCLTPQCGVAEETPVRVYHATLPWSRSVAALQVVRGKEVIGRLELGPRPPRVHVRLQRERRRGQRVRVSWQISGSQNVTVLLRFTNDGGQTWIAMGMHEGSGSRVFDLQFLPGGARCRFQVAASSALSTSTAESPAIRVAKKPRTARILLPAENARTLRYGSPMLLTGGCWSPDYGLSSLRETVWKSDRDGVLGFGTTVVAAELSVGKHQVTLEAPDGQKGMCRAAITLVVRKPESRNEPHDSP